MVFFGDPSPGVGSFVSAAVISVCPPSESVIWPEACEGWEDSPFAGLLGEEGGGSSLTR